MAQACPVCTGTHRMPLAPGYWQCTSVIRDAVPVATSGQNFVEYFTTGSAAGTGAPSVRVCRHRYLESEAGDEAAEQCSCGVTAIGHCLTCGRPVCREHAALLCRTCQGGAPTSGTSASTVPEQVHHALAELIPQESWDAAVAAGESMQPGTAVVELTALLLTALARAGWPGATHLTFEQGEFPQRTHTVTCYFVGEDQGQEFPAAGRQETHTRYLTTDGQVIDGESGEPALTGIGVDSLAVAAALYRVATTSGLRPPVPLVVRRQHHWPSEPDDLT